MVRLALLLVAACAVCAAATPRTWGDKRSIGISFDATDVCPAVSAQLLSQFVQAGASGGSAAPGVRGAAACPNRHPASLSTLKCLCLPRRPTASPADTGAPPLTKAAAAALACQLGVVISSADVGDANATDTLSTIYRAWRSAYKPHGAQLHGCTAPKGASRMHTAAAPRHPHRHRPGPVPRFSLACEARGQRLRGALRLLACQPA